MSTVYSVSKRLLAQSTASGVIPDSDFSFTVSELHLLIASRQKKIGEDNKQ